MRFIESTMSRILSGVNSTPAGSSVTGSSPGSPLLSSNGGHGIPLGRANVTQVAQSISVAAVRALE